MSDLINDFYDLMLSSKNSFDGLDKKIEYVLASYLKNDEEPSIKDADRKKSREKLFRECVDEELFKPRRLALESMKNGIRLEGKSC